MKHLLRFKTFLLMAIFSLLAGTSAWAQSDFSSTETSNVTLTAGTNGSKCTVNEKEGIKVGTGSNGGDMSVTVPAGTTHLHLHAAAWNNVSGLSINITGAAATPSSISLTSNSGISGNSPFTLSGNASDYYFVIELSGITSETTLKFTTSIKKRFVIWGVNAEEVSSGSNLSQSDFALTGAPVDLSFDLYNNSGAQVINYTTSSTGAVSIANSDYATFAINETNKTITVTPTAYTPTAQTITVNQAADDTYSAGSATFTLFVDDSTPSNGDWVETALADISTGDVFVIVGNNGNNYALSNDNGTGGAPSAVGVTVSGGKITSKVNDNIKWNVTGDATNGYTFFPNGTTETWLYCTNTNNGVRVGTNDSKTFTVSTEGYLVHSGTSRYVGVYNSSDWRCYTSINTNIENQTFTFYKYDDGTTPSKPSPELAFSSATAEAAIGQPFTAPTLTTAAGFNGTVEYSSSNESVAQVMDTETGELRLISAGETVIKASFAGNDDFKSGSASYTLTVTDNRIPTTISQDPILLTLAEVGTLTKLAPVVKDENDNVVAYSYGQWPTEVSFEIVNDPNSLIGSLDNNSGDITINSVQGTATLKAYYNYYNVNSTYRPSECTFTISVLEPKDGIAEFCTLNNNESGTLKLTDAVVLYTHGNDMFVKDATGAMDFYSAGLSYNVGDVLNGTITGTYKLYNNMPELTTPISNNTLVATAGSAPTPDEITTSDAADNVCNLVKLSSAAVTENSGKFYVDNVQVYDKFKLGYTIEAGKTYDIVGIMIPYNSTYEICPTEAPVEVSTSTTPSITISPDSYTMDAKAGGGELPVTCSNMPADPQLEVLFYESDGTTSATYDWISATINANGNIDGQIQENTGAARTAYFKVHGVDADNNDVYSNLVTFTQEAPVAATPTIVFNPNSIDFDANSGYRTIGGDYFQLKDFDSTPSLEILYYESDGDTEKQGGYDWLTADFNSNNQIDFTWGTNTGAARSAYLKIHAVGTTVYSNLFTINQAAANVAHYYQKVTADADLTDGQYLIVYEEGTVAFDGGLSTLDATSNTIDVTIVGDKIEGNSTTDAATFTIDVTAGTLQSASGLYIGQTSDANGIKANESTAYQNTLSIDADGNADVVSSGGAYLRYNATSGQDRFRYFKSSTYTAQKAIQLYKRVEGAMPAYVATPTFDPAAGEVQAGTLVTISTTTANATIRYTTDGSEPTTSNGEEYQKPIVINSNVTIKAIAVDDNQNVSAVAEATYTIATSSQLSPELTLDPKSLNVTEGAANGTVTVTTAAGYNGTITVMVDDPSVADASYDAGVITVVYGHAGSAVISVTAGADGDYVEQMEQISVNVSAPVQPAQAAVVVWSEDWSSFDLNDSETPAANGDFTYVYTNGDNATKLYDDVLAGGKSPELLINKNGGAFSATIPLYGAYGNMTLTFKTNNKLSEVRAKVDDDTNNDITLDPANVNGKNVYTLPFTVAEGANQVVLTFTNTSSKNLRIDDFQLTAPQVAVNISSVGYATMYYGSSNLVVPAGVTASTYWVDGDLLKVSQEYTEGAVLAKAQGYILNGAPGSYTFTATNDAANEDPKNLLCGSDVAVTTTAPVAGNFLFYLLGVDNGKVGFYWGKDNGAAFTSGAHKAYLAVPENAANGIRAFYFDDVFTGIDSLNLNVENENAYDLQGRRVQQLQKGGLYIINGKKMLAK